LREGDISKNKLEEKIREYEICEKISHGFNDFHELVEGKNFVQPKSVVIRLYYLDLILNSLPEYFYRDLRICKEEIMSMTVAVVMYYMGLNVYKYGKVPITATMRRNIVGREDCYFGLQEMQKVCGKISAETYSRYLDIFARDINKIKEQDSVKLYMYDEKPFILCMTDYLDYVMHEIERLFKEQYLEKEYSKYMNIKGNAFEELVFNVIKPFFEECYHTLYYYPGHKEKIELDIVTRNNREMAIIECKSGTIWFEQAVDDAAVKGTIKNSVKKAYKSLLKVAEHCAEEKGYCFENEDIKLWGTNEMPICMHVSMYPLDFIASNIHTLFPEYIVNKKNPVLSISFEHLCAILLDLREKDKSIFEYWKKRRTDILKYPEVRFDNNELDLYYELIMDSRDSMLTQIKEQGILDMMAPNVSILSTFRNENGYEERPAFSMLKHLDSIWIANIFAYGKSWMGLNKRYLKNLEEAMEIKEN